MNDKTENKGNGVRIWTGKLKVNGERKKEGGEVDARIVLTGASVVFELRESLTTDWREANPDEIHAPSWLRALGATGAEVG